ncbi:alpha/beta hydrolase family protein [Parapedobacter indicus]|uniref:Uncharacterized protein n=1 Tax=Parapedobacter indicus TaxID=1477437 RepID=A0A1I3GWS2_9SPHI|nr:hypothetical protein [Parapedobacter indicus]PPL02812.1 hypothetical protein CLV26_103138 [Parapedobacter indicus]SFI27904.1 hypothetical protein SAMN05444682_103137 [Parapedobacter indicus]
MGKMLNKASASVCFLVVAAVLSFSGRAIRLPGDIQLHVRPVEKQVIETGTIYRVVVKNADTVDSAVYSVFIPAGIDTLRGVFIHQHGCGMEGRGASTAYDLQYQAFAKKWGLAVVGPDLYYENGCRVWKNPESGSGPSLLKALEDVGMVSSHTELKEVPWLLWGHSGGGYWTLAMMKNYPERILAAFGYSPAFDPNWNYPDEALKIPLMIRHAGAGDINSGEVKCWQTAVHTFDKLRSAGGLVSIACTPHQNHNYSFVRYIAIPFYESVLSRRLPTGTQHSFREMRAINERNGWLADTLSLNTWRFKQQAQDANAFSWLPDSATAAKWKEFVITGSVIDRTPPLAPYGLAMRRRHSMAVELTWKADADIESGIKQFLIYSGNQLIARFPEQGVYQYFDQNGDDAIPMSALPEMKAVISLPANADTTLSLSTINHFDLESPRVSFSK